MIDVALIQACAPNVAVETVQAVVRVESGGDPLALNTNRHGGAVRLHPQDLADAVQLALQEIHAGNSVDLGLMQINSRNLSRLGMTLTQAFDPCNNLRGGALILTTAYVAAAKAHGDGQPALREALSTFNTGDAVSGFNNGYVARYYTAPFTLPAATDAANIYAADPTVFTRHPTEQLMEASSRPKKSEPIVRPLVVNDHNEFLTQGVQVALDPDHAESLGAFQEHGLSERDAWASQDNESAARAPSTVQEAARHSAPTGNVVPLRTERVGIVTEQAESSSDGN